MRSLKILVVEDHHETAESLSRLLRLDGYTVLTAESFASAMDVVRAGPVDLLLCDIALPDGDGCDLLRQIRCLFPVEGIAISGYGRAKDVERCLAAGYARHLLKPVTVEQIEESIAGIEGLRTGRVEQADLGVQPHGQDGLSFGDVRKAGELQ
jgi:CheY-like chemotaxis protein